MKNHVMPALEYRKHRDAAVTLMQMSEDLLQSVAVHLHALTGETVDLGYRDDLLEFAERMNKTDLLTVAQGALDELAARLQQGAT